MSLKIQAARGLKWQFAEIAGRQLISLVIFGVLARLLEPSSFGLIGLVGVYNTFAGLFADQGIGTALVQRKKLEPEHLDTAFWFNMGCAAILWLGTVALAEPISVLLGESKLASLLRWSSLGLVFTAASAIQAALFVKAIDFRRPAVRTIVSNVAGGVAGLLLAWRGAGVWALVAQQLVAALAGTAFLWSASSWRPGFRFSFRHLKDLLGVGSAAFIPSVLWFFASQLDQLVIGRLAGATVLGHYVMGAKLPILLRTAVQQPVSSVSMPVLSTLQDDHPRMCQAIYKAMELNALVSFPAFIGLASVAPDVVTVVFGAQWEPAVKFLQWQALYNLAYGMLIFIHPAMLLAGGRLLYIAANSVLAIGAAVACFAGIRLGPQVVIAGLIANMVVVGIVDLFLMRRRIGLSLSRYFRPCLGPAAAAVAMGASVIASRTLMGEHWPALVRLLLQVSVGIVTYLAALPITAPRSMGRLRQFTSDALLARPKPE